MTENRYIAVICQHCRKPFKIETSSNMKAFSFMLDYAICPHCNTPRYPHLYATTKKYSAYECTICHTPSKTKQRNGLCDLHYMRKYREKKHQAPTDMPSAIENNIVP